jgi:hypothetical protein
MRERKKLGRWEDEKEGKKQDNDKLSHLQIFFCKIQPFLSISTGTPVKAEFEPSRLTEHCLILDCSLDFM